MEYRILKGSKEEVQKILNQWKQQYNLTIISMILSQSTDIIILLSRIKRK